MSNRRITITPGLEMTVDLMRDLITIHGFPWIAESLHTTAKGINPDFEMSPDDFKIYLKGILNGID